MNLHPQLLLKYFILEKLVYLYKAIRNNTEETGLVAQVCNPSYKRGRGRETMNPRPACLGNILRFCLKGKVWSLEDGSVGKTLSCKNDKLCDPQYPCKEARL